MKYRAEIDGLRAVAVIPVVLFHAGFEGFSGGFVGVDVFFVISGYLITTIILSEKEQGTFSLVNFYERRARRILPALFVVMLVSLLFAWLWFYPSDMRDFSESLVAVSTFISNIHFWRESGYWGAANEMKPLLHTWSLSVEEQYYVLFPLFLMLMWRFGKRWILGSFMVIAVISLALAQWGAYNKPEANFFLLPTRGWELAIGAGIAFYFLYRKQMIQTLLSHKVVDEMLGFVGLLMIGYAVYYFNETVPFPSFYALIPTIGTGLVILFASPQTIVGRILSIKIFVSVGLISYSAYLWHQPLFAFARYRSLAEPSEDLFAILAFLSFPLGWLSWKYVEQPFRKKGIYSRTKVFSFAIAGSVLFIGIGLAGHFNDGWVNRIDSKIQVKNQSPGCSASEFHSVKVCKLVNGQNNLTFLIGDSHAGALAHEMQVAFIEKKMGLLHLFKIGCPPVKNVYRADGGNTNDLSCYEFNKAMYSFIKDNKKIENIVMSARWNLFIEGSSFDNREGGKEYFWRKPHLDLIEGEKPDYHPHYGHRSELAKRYTDSIQLLLDMGKKVILVYPVPEAGWNVPKYIYRYQLFNREEDISSRVGSTSYELFRERNKRTYKALDNIGSHPNLYRVYPEHILCGNDIKDRCIVQKDGIPLYKDDDHFSYSGAKLIVDNILRQMSQF